VIENDKSFCVCKEGYEGDPYVECEDVNECETLLNDCWITDDECVNLPGSYLCTCPVGFARNEATGNDFGCVYLTRTFFRVKATFG
jgi:hypothetical protein